MQPHIMYRINAYIQFVQQKSSVKPCCIPLRPQWDRCADFVPGGQMRWKELSEGKTSDQIVDILLNEISGDAADTGGAEYFDGQVR